MLAVVYLIFNEGYRPLAPAASWQPRRSASAGALTELMPNEPEANGLVAMMLLLDGRRKARFRDHDLVLLTDQDRSLWDMTQLAEGRAVLDRA